MSGAVPDARCGATLSDAGAKGEAVCDCCDDECLNAGGPGCYFGEARDG